MNRLARIEAGSLAGITGRVVGQVEPDRVLLALGRADIGVYVEIDADSIRPQQADFPTPQPAASS